MNKENLYRIVIKPIPEEVERPIWSVMIPTYNCARYLRETLASVLSQAPGSEVMQIEVIDDCSTEDDPEKVVKELGGDRVVFYRQPQNVGNRKNFQTCLERSRGKLIHLLHGDDCVRNGFYTKMQKAFAENPEIGAAFCRCINMDEHGHWQNISPLEQPESGILNNWLERLVEMQRISTPSMVVRREVYEKLGAFDFRLPWTEDWEMWVRIAAHFPVWYEVEPLAVYRTMRPGSLSKSCGPNGEIYQDIRRAINIFSSYLPETISEKLTTKSRENWAMVALRNASGLIAMGDISSAIIQIREGLKCSQSFRVIRLSVNLLIKAIIKWLWSKIHQGMSFKLVK